MLGVVFAPALDLFYCAGRGLGSWKQRGRDRPDLLARLAAGSAGTSRREPLASIGCARVLSAIDSRRRAFRRGSSLKFCRVAEGAADLYPRFGPMMEWDAAAGDCIYRYSAASGERPSPIRYNSAISPCPGSLSGPDDRWPRRRRDERRRLRHAPSRSARTPQRAHPARGVRRVPHLGMLWSIGKDSTVLLWLARKAFFGHVPFPLIHIDTSFKIPEMIAVSRPAGGRMGPAI